MTSFFYIILTVVAYLLGSLSGAIILGKLYYGVDIRTLGSGNPGASNAQRCFGWKAGVAVLFFDFLKGVGAVSLIYLTKLRPETELFVTMQIIFGLAAIIGHIFPLFFEFKGGQGVSVIAGVLSAIHPWAMLICFAVFIIALLLTKYISVSVLIAVLCYPILVNFMFGLWLTPDETITLRVFSIVIAVTLWLTHISNIKRLFKGTEEKFYFKKSVPPTVEKPELKTIFDKNGQ